MKHSYIIQSGHPRLLVFFAGWASDPTPFQNYRPAGRDYVVCYDYRTLESDFIPQGTYREADIVAWSMGVWAASHVAPMLDVPIGKSIAINGTPYPIDAGRGIPPAIWQGTLDNLSPLSLHKFTQRMCADTEAFHRFLRVTPRRPIDELAEGITSRYGSGWASSDTSPIYDYAFEVDKPVGLIKVYASDGYYKVSDFDYNNGVYTLKSGVADMPSVDRGYGTYPNPFNVPDGQSAFPGAMKLRDDDGDGQADIQEFEVNPKHVGGININATYKNFDFSAGFSWQAGGHVYNVAALLNMYSNGNASIGSNRLALVNDCFKYYQVDASGMIQAITDPDELEALNANAKYYSSYAQNGIATSDFIESNSFLRLQNLTIGYSLPKKLISKIGMQRCRIYATGGNLFTITGYSGLDPEVNAAVDRSGAGNNEREFPTLGLDFGSYPRARTFTFGVNIAF